MKNYYIYHVPGIKIGATKNWKRRRLRNFRKYNIDPIIIEIIEGPDTPEMWQIVGDREWELADQNDYTRGTHYKVMAKKSSKPRTIKQLQQIHKDFATHDGTNGRVGAPKLYKLTKEIADIIRLEYANENTSHRKLALKYDINKHSIGRILRNIGYLV